MKELNSNDLYSRHRFQRSPYRESPHFGQCFRRENFSLQVKLSSHKFSKRENLLSADKLLPCLQHSFFRSVENVILTNTANTVDGTSVMYDMLQVKCHADGYPMCADDTT